MFSILKQAAKEWSDDGAPQLAAALAYYTVFSIAPLLVLVIGVLSIVYGSESARQQLTEQLSGVLGQQATDFVTGMLERSSGSGKGVMATVISAITVVLGATTVFAQLQNALNRVWNVKPDPDKSGPLRILWVRLTSLGMVLVLGLLLFVSFAAQAALQAMSAQFSQSLPGLDWLWTLLTLVVTLGIITLLFAAIFKVLPDARIRWNEVWVGAVFTAVLFQLGSFAISFYIGRSGVTSTYGAAASLVVLLLWVYYSAQILMFGAEFTQVHARRSGARIEPAEHAVREGEA